MLYISNDESESELNKFVESHIDPINACYFQLGDHRIQKIRNELKIDCLPVVVVLDKTL